MKRTMLTTSAASMMAMAALAGPSQALVSQTDAPQNEQTDAIARLQLINKEDLKEAEKNQVGGMVSVKSVVCTSTLIDPQWVISAGHCSKDGIDDFRVTATFGIDRNSDKEYTITQVEKFSDNRDIALYKLDKPVEGVTPLKMWEKAIDEETQGTAYGWGREQDAPSLNTMNMLEGTISPEVAYGTPFPEMETNVARFDAGYSATGDSGSPFIIDNAVYGVLSMGGVKSDNDEGFPGSLYIPVAQYQKWIQAVIQNDDVPASMQDTLQDDMNTPAEDTQPIEAEVPVDDVALPETDVKPDLQGSAVSDSDSADVSKENDDDASADDALSAQGTQNENGTTNSPSLVFSPSAPASDEDALGPEVNTGGAAQSDSFFGKVMKLFT